MAQICRTQCGDESIGSILQYVISKLNRLVGVKRWVVDAPRSFGVNFFVTLLANGSILLRLGGMMADHTRHLDVCVNN
jgi:hypothetical protein